MTTIPSTFRSEAALAAAVDAAFAEALVQELAAALAEEAPARRPFNLPDTDTLVAQAGIVTGPCPPDPHAPSPIAQFTKQAATAGGRLAGRAAWWLLKATAYATAVVLREVIVLTWQLVFGTSSSPVPQLEQAPPTRPTGRAILASSFLEATSEEIGHRGWTQRRLENSLGQVCVRGAELSLIRSGTGTHNTARRANHHLLQVTGARSVPRWNDRLTRQEAQIHTALLAAAARARAAGE
ncbi:hypothetical protein ACIHCQ_42260 [Streptomyces sp. NPDC052236]|uniref:DUF6197 family protein n=1 Tax=Streptomyces sp. NPDC052236 TaxID=3365686 RepID=UPI0037D896E1